MQQNLIDTSDNAAPRETPLGVGPTINNRQTKVPSVVPSACDPNLLDASDDESTYVRSLIMYLRDGCTAEQAEQVVAGLHKLRDPEQRYVVADLLFHIAAVYGGIRGVAIPNIEAIMAEIMQPTTDAPDEGSEMSHFSQEQVEFYEEWAPKELIQRLSYVRAAEAKHAETEAMCAETEAKLAVAKEQRVTDLVEVLRARNIILASHELDQLRECALDDLPCVRVALGVDSREEFLDAAGLRNDALPHSDPDEGSDSNR